jgi:hypothetical protein
MVVITWPITFGLSHRPFIVFSEAFEGTVRELRKVTETDVGVLYIH